MIKIDSTTAKLSIGTAMSNLNISDVTGLVLTKRKQCYSRPGFSSLVDSPICGGDSDPKYHRQTNTKNGGHYHDQAPTSQEPTTTLTYPPLEVTGHGNIVFYLDSKLLDLGFGRYEAVIEFTSGCPIEFDLHFAEPCPTIKHVSLTPKSACATD